MRLLVSLLVVLVWFGTPVVWAAADGQEDICDSAAVILCENFNARAEGLNDLQRATYKNTGWQYSGLSGPAGTNSVVTGTDPTGASSRMVQMHCTDYNGGMNSCSSYMVLGVVQTAREIYTRWYVKWSSNYQFSSSGNKHIVLYFGPSNDGFNTATHASPPQAQFYNNLGFSPPDGACGPGPGGTFGYFICQTLNGPPVTFATNQWYCMEAHTKINDPAGASNAIQEMWIDGVLKISRFDLNIVALEGYPYRSEDRYYKALTLYGRWQCVNGADGPTGECVDIGQGTPVAHPIMDRWHDNLVMSTQRIGCSPSGGSQPPSDTTPPVSPSNLRVSSLWDQLLKVFWTLQ